MNSLRSTSVSPRVSMDQSERYSVEAYRLPLLMEDHEVIARMLHDREVFAPTFVPQADADVYNPLLYRHENLQHNTTTILLADRNVVTRWLALLAGKTPAPQDRLAAAIMVFARSANILIEPNLALYEAAMAEGSEQANQELVQFRIADNLDIKHWADLALGRKQKLSIPERALADIPKKPDAINFEIRLRRWSRNYIILLKLAELELRGLDRTRQITEFATWMYQDFIMGGPVLIFALYYLTPNSERSGLLKHLRSADRERALSGIRNASWDLTLLSEWIRRAGMQKETNTLTLLCSFDRKLIILARILAPRLASNLTDEEFRRSSMMAILELWGKKQADQIVGLIGRFIASPDNPSRQIHRPDEVDIKGMIQAGEKFVRDWRA